MYSERRSAVPGGTVWQVEPSTASAPADDGAAPPVPRVADLVVPDGSMDILWSEGRLLVAGPDTRGHLAPLGPGRSAAGLRFAPGAAPAVLGVPAHELVDRRVPLEDLWPATVARRLSDAVERTVSGGPTAGTAARVAGVVERDVSRRPGADGSTGDAVGRGVMLRMATAGAGVAEVARATGWSERQLRRHSHDLFGYGLTTLRRVLRLQAAVRLAAQGWTLAEVAARSGYADQAHLSREVVALTGRTPAVVLPRPAQPSGAKRSTGLPSGSSTVA
ncbi:hypothetical protein Sked_17370 [Sanguibacter keddieii DSM 10542]|uniref:HTH araC/xylS-type domain-containing protein n=1 Tax=Sanguibacter keddieii (strain ATCC 51767 / DSM 10542 / NCFB 3025 / ST-74) TaxID=446469 RepID=D1BGT7_SANKS|nr:AraC family transcriptional regulator [Sanguibacter keddieii]ACZ21664.1 hypothetical protein Sked_17370 [Sanguibacter keddieii DSM 10542]